MVMIVSLRSFSEPFFFALPENRCFPIALCKNETPVFITTAIQITFAYSIVLERLCTARCECSAEVVHVAGFSV